MTHRIRVGRPVWAYVAALCLVASGAVGGSCYNGDQWCAEAYNPNDLGDHCPYGPPGGPKVGDFPDGCPQLESLEGDPACATVTWDAVKVMMLDPERGNCAGNGCHLNDGIGGIDGLVADPNNPTDPADNGLAMLDSLGEFAGNYGTAYPNVVGGNAVPRLYYDRKNPQRSWWHCNVKGDAGSLMPRGKLRLGPADIELLETWLACGAPGDPAP